jgi:hypothetical protein
VSKWFVSRRSISGQPPILLVGTAGNVNRAQAADRLALQPFLLPRAIVANRQPQQHGAMIGTPMGSSPIGFLRFQSLQLSDDDGEDLVSSGPELIVALYPVLRLEQDELNGRHGHQALQGFRAGRSQRHLTGQKRKEVTKACNYFENNRQRMRYDEYLQAGYPIASGVIEGACRHIIKDRMEQGGMRWTRAGAQAMLNVRSVCASSAWKCLEPGDRPNSPTKCIHTGLW